MRPALEVLLSKAKDRDTEKLHRFANDAVHDFIEKVKSLNESILSKEVKQKVIEKLNRITILSELFARNFSEQNLDDYYEELNLNGDENLVQTALEMQKFYKRIENDYKNHFTEGSKIWLDTAAQRDLILYDILSDELSKFSVQNTYIKPA